MRAINCSACAGYVRPLMDCVSVGVAIGQTFIAGWVCEDCQEMWYFNDEYEVVQTSDHDLEQIE
jgi:hypothetical protein